MTATLSRRTTRIWFAALLIGAVLGCSVYAFSWMLAAVLSGLLAGALLAFGLSFDEIVVTTFTSGPGIETLPLRMPASPPLRWS